MAPLEVEKNWILSWIKEIQGKQQKKIGGGQSLFCQPEEQT